jgi:pyruvate kinase
MERDRTHKIITLGPATQDLDLRRLTAKGVDFVRNNMSHSSLDELVEFTKRASEADLPFILDTEGSQVRTSVFDGGAVEYAEGQTIRLHADAIVGNAAAMSLTPSFVVAQLQVGDIVHIDFDALILLVIDTADADRGFVTASAINRGSVGNRKAVYLDRVSSRHIVLPTLSEKDAQAIDIALECGVEHIAASFIRSAHAVDEVREATRGRMKVISKIECVEALENLDAIIERSDYLLLDRGDLSKEIPLEKVPYVQKIVLERARRQDTGVVVATNLLETMIEKRRPTRAEVNDIINTIQDGAVGLTLAAETAIGKHPIECINVINKLIAQASAVESRELEQRANSDLVDQLLKANFLFDNHSFSTLAKPHGGSLVDRVLRDDPSDEELAGLARVPVDDCQQMDLRQIATGAYSPLEGYMGSADLAAVLDDMHLASGVVWPLPIVLDVSPEVAKSLTPGERIALVDCDDRDDHDDHVVATMDLEEIYQWDRSEYARKLFGTADANHPGVASLRDKQPFLLAGPIQWIPHAESDPNKAYCLTPRQVRRLFEERAWSSVVAFHTRNIPHRAHEYIQRTALAESYLDGLFVHPVVGKKKPGDFEANTIIACHKRLIRDFYPRDQVVFATFATFSRYAGPREALFTALCRKNFGCSHFIVGRDHTGVGDYYAPRASQEIFERFPDLGIEAICFEDVLYSKDLDSYFQAGGKVTGEQSISGSELRRLLKRGERPAEWMIRPEISQLVIDAIEAGVEVFVGE